MRAEEQVARMLRMVPYLSAHQGVAVAEVARVFGTTPAQVVRDLEVLQFCGLPGGYYDDLFDVDIEAAREEGHVYFRNADVLRPTTAPPARRGSGPAGRAAPRGGGGGGIGRRPLRPGQARGRSREGGAAGPGGRGRDRPGPALRVDRRHRGAPRGAPDLPHPGAHRAVGGRRRTGPAPLRRTASPTSTRGAGPAKPGGPSGWTASRVWTCSTTRRTIDGEPPSAWFDDVARRLTITVAPSARWITEYFPTTSVAGIGGRDRGHLPRGIDPVGGVAAPAPRRPGPIRLGRRDERGGEGHGR